MKKETRQAQGPSGAHDQAATAEESVLPASPPPPAPGNTSLFSRHTWLKPVFLLFGILAGLFAAMKISKNLNSAQLAKAIYLAFFLGVSVFLYKVYTDHLVQGTLNVKNRLIGMLKKANLREVPAVEEKTQEAPK